MTRYENFFGKFPFIRDSYELVECPHTGMNPKDFKIADSLFFVDLKLRWSYLDPSTPLRIDGER